jgi:hypothetical protein
MDKDEAADMLIVETVTKAVIIIREVFDLSSDETSDLIDALYDKLIEFGALRSNENRTN